MLHNNKTKPTLELVGEVGDHAGVQGGWKVRGTAAEWENSMGGGVAREKRKQEVLGRGVSLFSVSKINYFNVCSLLGLYR